MSKASVWRTRRLKKDIVAFTNCDHNQSSLRKWEACHKADSQFQKWGILVAMLKKIYGMGK